VRPCGYIGEITLYNIDLVNVFAKRELCLVKAANDGGDLKAPIVAEALNELSAGAPSPAQQQDVLLLWQLRGRGL
jgi:hypothetical protein